MNNPLRKFLLGTLKTIGKLIIVIVLFAGCIWWLMGGRLWVSSDNCAKGHLATETSCVADSEAGWMNSGAYYMISHGTPKPEFCPSFIENYEHLDSPIGESCPSWTETSCQPYPRLEKWQCFQCDRPAINANTHYYLFAANSPDCTKGVFFSGSQHKPEEFIQQIGAD